MEKEKKIAIILIIFGIVLTLMGSTFAYWQWASAENQKTSVTFNVTSGFSCSADGGGDITSNDRKLAPTDCIDPEYAIKRTVKTNVTKNSNGEVSLDMWLTVNHQDAGLKNSQNFKYALTTASNSCTSGVVASGNFNGINDNGKVNLLNGVTYSQTKTDTYYLYIWLDAAETSTDTMNQNFSLSLGGKCTNEISRDVTPNKPVLDPGMIPVKIANNGAVTTVSENDSTWYNYSNKEWANAVLVKDSGVKTRDENKVIGTTINRSDILAYYVWVPRYKYSMFSCSQLANPNPTDNPDCYEYNITSEGMEYLVNLYTQMIMQQYGMNETAARPFAVNQVNQFIDENGAEKVIQFYEENGFQWLDDDDKAIMAAVAVSQMGITQQQAYQIYNNIVTDGSVSDLRQLIQMVLDYNANKGASDPAITPAFDYELALIDGTPAETPINIVFESASSPKSTGTAVGTSYYTHPAFTFGTQELSGIWIGKFETTGNATTPTVLDNVSSLRSQNVSTQFTTAQKFGTSTYGITSSDAHMMKNSEWGAAAYLSHSKYGVNTEVRINNNSNYGNYTTGCGALEENGSSTSSCEIQYGNASSYPQSTTGNISGIFDMSGGAFEYVMGHWSDNLNSPTYEYSGFSSMPDAKYYDLYDSSTFDGDSDSNIQKCTLATCGGHALNETAGWYSDYAIFVNSSLSWFLRGGNSSTGAGAGVFNFGHSGGYAYDSYSFRSVLVAR